MQGHPTKPKAVIDYTVIHCSHRAITMVLILVEVPVELSSSVPSVCDCRGLINHFHRYLHQNKLPNNGSEAAVCDCCGPTSHFYRYFHQNK